MLHYLEYATEGQTRGEGRALSNSHGTILWKK